MVKWRAKAKPGASRWGCGATIASFAASAEEAEDLAADFSETSAIVTTPYVRETASKNRTQQGLLWASNGNNDANDSSLCCVSQETTTTYCILFRGSPTKDPVLVKSGLPAA